MKIRDFQLERYFAKYEFSAGHLLSPSDCEPLAMRELLDMAVDDDLGLWDGLVLGYTESPGHPLLRSRIAAMHERVEPEDVLCAVPEEGVFLAMNALLEPGDRVIALHPAYQSLYEVARAAGCEVDPWPLIRDDGAWALDFETLRALLQKSAELVVVNFPHNPTGFQPSREEYESLLAMVESAGARVFSDEMYRGLEFGEAPRLPSAADFSQTAVSLSGLSKTYALPGLRSGWLACRDREFLSRAQSLKDYTTICGSAPSEILSIIALANSEKLIRRSRDIVRENLAPAEEFFASRRDEFRFHPPRAGSVCLAELLTGEPAYDFCEAAVTQNNVMVVPSQAFDMEGEFIRLGLGRKSFPKALSILGEFLNERK
jgi:aspartate/methionine/tyrosine aminotransferase